jgi:polyhydroxyalkanoate synthesis regulator phasin
MDLSDLLDIIFTSEEDLRRLGAQGGPEARKVVEDAVAATRRAREEAEGAFGKIFERAGLCRRSELEALAKQVEALTSRVRDLELKLAATLPHPEPPSCP